MPAWTQLLASDPSAPFRHTGILGPEHRGLAERNARHAGGRALEPGHVSLALVEGRDVVGGLHAWPNEFESERFGVRVLRADGPAFAPGVDREDGARELASAVLHAQGPPTLVIASVESGDLSSVVGFQRAGFTVHDSVLTLAMPTRRGSGDGTRSDPAADGVSAFCRDELRVGGAADAGEVDRLAAMAPEMFGSSHFHADRRLAAAAADEVYRRWTRAVFAGEWADWMLVARDDDGSFASFVAFAIDRRIEGGPVVLGSSFGFSVPPHGRGFTSRLSARLGDAPADLVTTVVQARNLAQVNGLQRAGMQVVRSALVMHGWRS